MWWLLLGTLLLGLLNLALSVLILTLMLDQHYRVQGLRWWRRAPRPPGNGH